MHFIGTSYTSYFNPFVMFMNSKVWKKWRYRANSRIKLLTKHKLHEINSILYYFALWLLWNIRMYERQVHPCFIYSMNAWNDYVRGEQIELFTRDLVKETGKLLLSQKLWLFKQSTWKGIGMVSNNLASLLNLDPWMFSGRWTIVLLFHLEYIHCIGIYLVWYLRF